MIYAFLWFDSRIDISFLEPTIEGENHEDTPSNDQQVSDEMTLGSASLLGKFISATWLSASQPFSYVAQIRLKTLSARTVATHIK